MRDRKGVGAHLTTFGSAVALLLGLSAGGLEGRGVMAAEPAAGQIKDLVRAAQSGDSQAIATIEDRLEPFFERKDLWTIERAAVVREIGSLLGVPTTPAMVGWSETGSSPASRLLWIDLGMTQQAEGGSGAGLVAYAIVEKTREGDPSVSWYHDLGRKLGEQGGVAWHPTGVRTLTPRDSAGARAIVVEEAGTPGGDAAGLLILEQSGKGWSAAARIAPPGGGRLVGVGEGGAVFLARRTPPAGVLSGAPPEIFRALAYYERRSGSFETSPVIAPVPDPVTAAEAVIAALRSGAREEARRLCASPDVLDALLYFSPGWKGGGRIVSAGRDRVEFIYEERERPTLRIEMVFEGRSGALLLVSATGRAESGK